MTASPINFKDRTRPFCTVDMLIFVGRDMENIVLIERAKEPFGFALPGGHVEYGESLEQAAIREAKEETNLDIQILRQFYTYSLPDRDPRSHTMSTAYICSAQGKPVAGDDAAKVHLVTVDEALVLAYENKFAFDHGLILEDVMTYLKTGERRAVDDLNWKSLYAPRPQNLDATVHSLTTVPSGNGWENK